MINVRQLREYLDELDDELIVVLQKDAEGNGYSPLADQAEVWYEPVGTWSGEVYEIGDLFEVDEDELDELQDNGELYRALVLAPVN